VIGALDPGIRMGALFAVAKAHTDLPLAEVERLLDEADYEPRLAAFCILDFQVRRNLDDDARRDRYDLYLRRHDRITTWDMVDRSAPRVIGRYLVGRSLDPLHQLAKSPEPLRRRSAITAPLWFARYGPDDENLASFAIAARLAADPDPVVHKPVGIFLKHAGERDRRALHGFLDEHAASMARPALRLATEKLSAADQARYRS
jgi:3-methyladenine DNA glycosylase AlkD